MKKFFAMILSLAMTLSLAACGESQPAETPDAPDAPVAETPSTFPEEDIKIIVPFDAGGGNDIIARIIAKVAQEGGYFNGKNVIVENQPGGGGSIGQAYVANTAEPDGYTLLTYTSSVLSNSILKDVPFSAEDFKIIVWPNKDAQVLLTSADAPYDDLDGLAEYVKTNKILIADDGFGSGSHISTLDWTTKLGEVIGQEIDWEPIHVDSAGIKATELMGGHADITQMSVGECADMILSGDLKPLAVMDTERASALPDVPTSVEQGYETLTDISFRCIACSSDVPDDAYNYLVEEFTRLCSSQEYIDAMTAASLVPICGSAEESQVYMQMRIDLYNSVKDYIKSGGAS